ncbi:helix-turn-helix domain-containing protein [Faecalicatena orotica]|uniref:AraC family transcriptional regulator n=1 Tax=Faecalicatena orotica TaxID=1544 RepID=A0A2Y9BPE6_9FIRM|nr:AraC family transcriptional regulator [Faecalicatena orotica]PWJ22648.1 AraC family transcriptional regulator [Faecalicatena orotica]SSA58317.1 transcriptional regulator, AraC family [Faecalicatena orotica]
MYAWEAIQKTLDYIETNISEEFEIEWLANEAALSLFYYQRLFSRLVRKPVREYIKLRRLARACQSLESKKTRILDIALDCGFKNHETFTRAFKEAYGMTPESYREHPVMLNQFDKPDLLLHYVMIDEGVPLISDGLVLEFNRKTLEQPVLFMGVTGIIPIDGQIPLGEATGVDMPGEVWQRLHREKHGIPRVKGGREIGVAYLGDVPEGYFTYFAGSEVEQGAEASHFVKWELPAREYVVCGFEAENFEQLVTVAINKAVKYCRLWLEKHGLTMDEYSPEMYYNSLPDAVYMELWMPVSESTG